jgi:hypothetical protein
MLQHFRAGARVAKITFFSRVRNSLILINSHRASPKRYRKRTKVKTTNDN